VGLDLSLKVVISQDSYTELIVCVNVLHWHLIDRIINYFTADIVIIGSLNTCQAE
jgi:hypothetical protein